jgi:hypothetical protein
MRAIEELVGKKKQQPKKRKKAIIRRRQMDSRRRGKGPGKKHSGWMAREGRARGWGWAAVGCHFGWMALAGSGKWEMIGGHGHGKGQGNLLYLFWEKGKCKWEAKELKSGKWQWQSHKDMS